MRPVTGPYSTRSLLSATPRLSRVVCVRQRSAFGAACNCFANLVARCCGKERISELTPPQLRADRLPGRLDLTKRCRCPRRDHARLDVGQRLRPDLGRNVVERRQRASEERRRNAQLLGRRTRQPNAVAGCRRSAYRSRTGCPGLLIAHRAIRFGTQGGTVKNEGKTAQARLLEARLRVDTLLKDTSGGSARDLPDDTLDLVACCLNAIADVIARRRAMDAQQPTEPAAHETPWAKNTLGASGMTS
jgi:hypothetical protein